MENSGTYSWALPAYGLLPAAVDAILQGVVHHVEAVVELQVVDSQVVAEDHHVDVEDHQVVGHQVEVVGDLQVVAQVEVDLLEVEHQQPQQSPKITTR